MSEPSPSFTRYIFSLLALSARIQSINWDIVEIITLWLRSIWSSSATTELGSVKSSPNRSERKLQQYSDSGEDWYRGRDWWTPCWTGWWAAAASGIVACVSRGSLTCLLPFLCCPFWFSLSQLLLRLLYGLIQNTEVIFCTDYIMLIYLKLKALLRNDWQTELNKLHSCRHAHVISSRARYATEIRRRLCILKTNQMFFFQTTPEKCLNATIARQFRFVPLSKPWAGSLRSNRFRTKIDLFRIKSNFFSHSLSESSLYGNPFYTLGMAGEITWYSDVVFGKFHFQSISVQTKTKPEFSNSCVLKSVFEKVR